MNERGKQLWRELRACTSREERKELWEREVPLEWAEEKLHMTRTPTQGMKLFGSHLPTPTFWWALANPKRLATVAALLCEYEARRGNQDPYAVAQGILWWDDHHEPWYPLRVDMVRPRPPRTDTAKWSLVEPILQQIQALGYKVVQLPSAQGPFLTLEPPSAIVLANVSVVRYPLREDDPTLVGE